MEKANIKESLRIAIADRPFFWVCLTLLFIGLVACLVVGFNIHISDVTVYSRYTAFGEAHFYKSHWEYLLLFVFFNALVAVAHAAMMVKLHSIQRRQTGLLVGWMGIIILLVATVYALSVIQLGQAA
ncbi:MAG: hypothetical protein ABIP74_02185 [Candidatus Saccharimonas sp.]